jgi:hypothetical protein
MLYHNSPIPKTINLLEKSRKEKNRRINEEYSFIIEKLNSLRTRELKLIEKEKDSTITKEEMTKKKAKIKTDFEELLIQIETAKSLSTSAEICESQPFKKTKNKIDLSDISNVASTIEKGQYRGEEVFWHFKSHYGSDFNNRDFWRAIRELGWRHKSRGSGRGIILFVDSDTQEEDLDDCLDVDLNDPIANKYFSAVTPNHYWLSLASLYQEYKASGGMLGFRAICLIAHANGIKRKSFRLGSRVIAIYVQNNTNPKEVWNKAHNKETE